MRHQRCGRASQRRSATGAHPTHTQHHGRLACTGLWPTLIQPTPSTTGVRRPARATEAHPTHTHYHGRSHACACHQRWPNPHPAPRALACAWLRPARPNPHPARRALTPRSIRLIGWHRLHRRASTTKHGREWNHGQHGYRPTGGRSAGGGVVVSKPPEPFFRLQLPKSARSRRSAGTPCWAGTPMDGRSGHVPPALQLPQPTALGNRRCTNPHPARRACACAGLRRARPNPHSAARAIECLRVPPALLQATLSTTGGRIHGVAAGAAQPTPSTTSARTTLDSVD